MSKFDKNFHINMSPFYFVVIFMFFMLWASEVKSGEIEKTVVFLQQL